MTTVFEIYTDGACPNNQSRDKSGLRAGSGVFFEKPWDAFHQSVKVPSRYPQTNNSAELFAVLVALKTIRLILQDNGTKKEETITWSIKSDSKYCVDGLNDWIVGWKKKGWTNSKGKPVLNLELWQEVDQEMENFKGDYPLHSIQIEYVKGHAGISGNEEADRLANLALV